MALSNGGLVVYFTLGPIYTSAKAVREYRDFTLILLGNAASTQCAFRGDCQSAADLLPNRLDGLPYPACSSAATIRACAPRYILEGAVLYSGLNVKSVRGARGNRALGDCSWLLVAQGT